MNIFVLDQDPIKAAQFACDKHSSKMCVELFQQLGSAVIRHGATSDMMPLTAKGTPLKGGYHNHPCTRWCGDSRTNYNWASIHALELCNEYTRRYDKIHACQKGIEKLCDMDYLIPEGELTNQPCAMPDQYKSKNVVESYRNYYINEKSHFAKWEKGTPAPLWFIDGISRFSLNYQQPTMVED
jgi:hypothetical protein